MKLADIVIIGTLAYLVYRVAENDKKITAKNIIKEGRLSLEEARELADKIFRLNRVSPQTQEVTDDLGQAHQKLTDSNFIYMESENGGDVAPVEKFETETQHNADGSYYNVVSGKVKGIQLPEGAACTINGRPGVIRHNRCYEKTSRLAGRTAPTRAGRFSTPSFPMRSQTSPMNRFRRA